MLRFALIIIVAAVAIYFVVRMMQGGGPGLGGTSRGTRPIAPDDDPDFLRDLDRRRREDTDS